MRNIGYGSLVLLLTAGCAAVNPRPDYARAAQQVEAATGHGELYRPDDDELTTARVNELLAGGLTADKAAEVALLNNLKLQAALYEIGMPTACSVARTWNGSWAMGLRPTASTRACSR
jgi:hypothetical protein